MKLNLQSGPFVVGVASSLDGNFALEGDLVEVRLDKIPPRADWLQRCQAIEAQGRPVLLTIRLRSEGGDWPVDDETRWQMYEQGLTALAAVDVELSSDICSKVTKLAQNSGKVCLVSYHNFEKTPSLAELETIVERAQQNNAVAKVATMIHSAQDVETLKALIKRANSRPICVIGMGDAWKETRVEFPKLGSCLTYGYLNQPTAPGQWSAAELVVRLKQC